MIKNVIANRYATDLIKNIFSEEGRTLLEREFWINIMKIQKDLGLNISDEDIKKYEDNKNNINLDLIKSIEKVTKHDLKAKIEAFNQIANSKGIHEGMTSRDLTDNVEQIIIKRSCEIILNKYVAILNMFKQVSNKYSNLVLTGRTHHQPAQLTIYGKRLAMSAEELYEQVLSFEHFIEKYPFRGIQGAVGTRMDMIKLLGSNEKVAILEKKLADKYNFKRVLNATGQIYPRSLDAQLVNHLFLLSTACANFATNIRLMAGYDLVNEGFAKGQTGSSAMPHKRNPRSSERIISFKKTLSGYMAMAAQVAGDQWEEGDISDSMVRRVFISDSFFASDGICETTLTVLKNMGAYELMFEKEVNKYALFLATTSILMLCLEKGLDREEAHEIIKKYAVNEAVNMVTNKDYEINLLENLSKDDFFINAGISFNDLNIIFKDIKNEYGSAKKQIEKVNTNIDVLLEKYPSARDYSPGDIL